MEGRVSHVTGGAPGKCGFGVCFLALSGEQRASWQRFVDALARAGWRARPSATRPTPAPAPSPRRPDVDPFSVFDALLCKLER